MFLLDNNTVRAGWAQAKAVVTNSITKHGGVIHSARRWAERPLAYGIRGHYRATYLLTYFDMPGDNVPAFQRELEIREEILRHLQVCSAGVPEGEAALAALESSADFSVPEPPADTPPPVAPELFAIRDDRRERRPRPEEEIGLLAEAPGAAEEEEDLAVLAVGDDEEDA
jgi:ribosomal protein S6